MKSPPSPSEMKGVNTRQRANRFGIEKNPSDLLKRAQCGKRKLGQFQRSVEHSWPYSHESFADGVQARSKRSNRQEKGFFPDERDPARTGSRVSGKKMRSMSPKYGRFSSALISE